MQWPWQRKESAVAPPLPLGRRGEELAVGYLNRLGYRILEQNFRTRRGEIDIIAEDGDTLVFIEVKTRKGASHGSPFESVTLAKQQRIARVAEEYLQQHALHERPARFDVIAVLAAGAAPQIELIKNAFDLNQGF